MIEDNNNKKLLTSREAAEMLGFKVSTLHTRRMRKQPPIYYKINRSVRYDIKDLEEYIQKAMVLPQDDKPDGHE